MKNKSTSSDRNNLLPLLLFLIIVEVLIIWSLNREIEANYQKEARKDLYIEKISHHDLIVSFPIKTIYDSAKKTGYVKFDKPDILILDGMEIINQDSLLAVYNKTFYKSKDGYCAVPLVSIPVIQRNHIDKIKINFKKKTEQYYRHNIVAFEEEGISYVDDWSEYGVK